MYLELPKVEKKHYKQVRIHKLFLFVNVIQLNLIGIFLYLYCSIKNSIPSVRYNYSLLQYCNINIMYN